MKQTFHTALAAVDGRKIIIIAIREWVVADPHERMIAHAALRMATGLPTVLVAYDRRGHATLDGEARFMRAIAKLGLEKLMWHSRQIDFARPAPLETWLQRPLPASLPS
jgi:hypothetical protein